MASDFIAVIQAGHSHTKVATGWEYDRKPRSFSFPSGVTRKDLYSPDLFENSSNISETSFGQREWVVGLHANSLLYPRHLHWQNNYTDAFVINVLSALERQAQNYIDRCILVVPDAQAMNPSEHSYLKQLFEGEHVLGERVITIKEVQICSATEGVFVKYITDLASEIEKKNIFLHDVAVLDIGHVSLDYGVIQSGNYVSYLSGSSQIAVSNVLQKAVELFVVEHRDYIRPEKFELALYYKQSWVELNGKEYEIASFIETASKSVCEMALKEAQSAFRGACPALLILSGGGSNLFMSHTEGLFTNLYTRRVGIKGAVEGAWYRAVSRKGRILK